MSGERILLDPSEVAPNRTQLDITDWVRVDGVDWGDAEIEAYRASGVYGDTVIDYRVPNRQVTMPLMLKAAGGTSFATIRESIQSKAALFQAEGGWLKRVTASGGTFYADVQVSGLKLSGGWMQAHKDADTEAEIRLECSPDFYGDEAELPDHVETSAAELVFTDTAIDGNYPARVRLVVDEDQGQAQMGLMWCFQSRNYSSADTARLAYEAEALQPLDTAARAALSGASGGTVVTHGTLSTNWTPVLNLNLGGTAYLTHAGTYRLRCRYRTTSGTTVALRSVYDVGDSVFPVENSPWYHPAGTAGTAFYVADLGELRLAQGPVGTHRWAGQIQGKGLVGTENVSLDEVWFQAVDESGGLLRGAVSADAGLSAYSARDSFNQAAGTLGSKVAPVGGTWASAGVATDFSVESTGKTVQRTTAVAEATPRLATLPVSLAAVAARVDMQCSTSAFTVEQGLVVRYVNSTNYLLAMTNISSGVDAGIAVLTVIGGAMTQVASGYIPGVRAATWFTVAVVADAAGRVFLFGGVPGGALVQLDAAHNVALATGGTLASGAVGLYDRNPDANAITRSYDNLAAWVPTLDAVLNPSQSAELRTDGMFREDMSGSASGPVSWVEGDLPRLPVSGLEGRTVRGMVKASRGDFGALPDTGIDDISARLYYRPCWLNVPGT